MNSGPKPVAELRNWVRFPLNGNSFNGYVFNDITHTYPDGHFLTVEGHVSTNHAGHQVYVGARIYTLWFAHQKVPKKDLLDEN